jgi:hypothetical protein
MRGSRAKRRVYSLRAGLIRSFGPPSPPGRRGACGQAAGAVDRSGSRFLSDAACRGEPARPAPLEPIEGAITRSPQRREVVGQEHEAERKHPRAENRQDGEASADDQQDAGRDARPARGGLPEPPGDRLHPARQAAKEPPQLSLRVGESDVIRIRHGVRVQASEIGSPAGSRNPYFLYAAIGPSAFRRARPSWPLRRVRRR